MELSTSESGVTVQGSLQRLDFRVRVLFRHILDDNKSSIYNAVLARAP